MTTYRTTDLAKWGVGKGSKLTSSEADNNIWDIIQRVTTLEADLPDAAASIDHFETSGSLFYVHMSDSTILGPYDLPIATFDARGEWQPDTAYSVLDTFTINGSLYVVIFDHISDSTFDPGANDGSGHDYYSLMLETPGNVLPTGGAVGQVVQKSGSGDFEFTFGWKLPTGGTARQYLIKVNGTQDNAAWGTPQADDVEFTPVTGSALTSSNVADALEELSVSSSGALADLSDVLFATGDPTFGAILYFDSENWTATVEPTINPSIMMWDGSTWAPTDPTTIDLTFAQLTDSPSVDQLRNTTITNLGTSGTVNLDPSLGNIFAITPSGAVSLDATAVPAGAEITIIVSTSGTTSYNITFNSNFKSQGVLATGTVNNKTFVVKFISNLSAFNEISRTTAM